MTEEQQAYRVISKLREQKVTSKNIYNWIVSKTVTRSCIIEFCATTSRN